ncbi:MAG: DinB family protein [Gemmatimonadota bacterium]|nr:MAG: DinB family protein [Gemmatimonadota bacterium]
MQENERIADELDRMNHGGAWHGPAIEETLDGVSASDAAARPIPGAHSIWEIVLHMTAWAEEVGRRLSHNARPLHGEADWPTPVESAVPEWESARSRLAVAHQRLRQAIREFPPSRLQESVTGNGNDAPPASFYVMLHGLAQHDAYHTGQIAILKRALQA